MVEEILAEEISAVETLVVISKKSEVNRKIRSEARKAITC